MRYKITILTTISTITGILSYRVAGSILLFMGFAALIFTALCYLFMNTEIKTTILIWIMLAYLVGGLEYAYIRNDVLEKHKSFQEKRSIDSGGDSIRT